MLELFTVIVPAVRDVYLQLQMPLARLLTNVAMPIFGASLAGERVVVDRNRITGGGVTAGIDFGLTLVGHLRDREYAEGVQLMAEYDPKPPYSAGTPESAPAEVRAMIEGMFTDFVAEAEKVGRTAFARFGRL